MFTRAFGEVNHVAFDFDGTLANTVTAHEHARRQAFVDMAEHYGDERFVQVPDAIHVEAQKHGSHPVSIIGWVLKEAGIIENLQDQKILMTVARKRQIYQELAHDGLQPIEGMLDVVRTTAESLNGSVSIVTTAPKDEVVPFIHRYGLEDIFRLRKNLITAEDVSSRLKPHPRAYELAVQKQKLADVPGTVLAIEDSPRGVESARRAGIMVVGLLTTHTESDFAAVRKRYQPTRIVRAPSDLNGLLKPLKIMRGPGDLSN